MTDSKREAARTERALKFDAAIALATDPEAGQHDVAKAIIEYGSACFMHGGACAR